jgi:hypothetical protein
MNQHGITSSPVRYPFANQHLALAQKSRYCDDRSIPVISGTRLCGLNKSRSGDVAFGALYEAGIER